MECTCVTVHVSKHECEKHMWMICGASVHVCVCVCVCVCVYMYVCVYVCV